MMPILLRINNLFFDAILMALFSAVIIIKDSVSLLRWPLRYRAQIISCAISLFIILLISEFFAQALADGFSLCFALQQVSSGLLDSPQYSGWSQ